MKDITIRIFSASWHGHSGMKLLNGKFVCFLDESQVEIYKVLQSKKAGVVS
jgi:hypothetical protein